MLHSFNNQIMYKEWAVRNESQNKQKNVKKMKKMSLFLILFAFNLLVERGPNSKCLYLDPKFSKTS